MTSIEPEVMMNQSEQGQARIPGETGIWIFIFGDLLVFGLFFATFLFYRAEDIELFNHSQEQLNQFFGVLNTVVLLTSSWLVASAMHAARIGREKAPSVMFLLALACGAGFIVIKILEYSEKIQAGIAINTNDFFMYYFVFTGIHAIHVLIGMGVLTYLALYSRARGGAMTAQDINTLESGSIFWHLVDLLWIVLFALLYLVR
jgi:nitric oxide reductase NorE protein